MSKKPTADQIFDSLVLGGIVWGIGWAIVYSLFLCITLYPHASIILMFITGIVIGFFVGLLYGCFAWILFFVSTRLSTQYPLSATMSIFLTILSSALILFFAIPLSPEAEYFLLNSASIIFGSWYLIQRTLKLESKEKEKRKNSRFL